MLFLGLRFVEQVSVLFSFPDFFDRTVINWTVKLHPIMLNCLFDTVEARVMPTW